MTKSSIWEVLHLTLLLVNKLLNKRFPPSPTITKLINYFAVNSKKTFYVNI